MDHLQEVLNEAFKVPQPPMEGAKRLGNVPREMDRLLETLQLNGFINEDQKRYILEGHR